MSRRSRAGNRPPHHRPAAHARREHDRGPTTGRPRSGLPGSLPSAGVPVRPPLQPSVEPPIDASAELNGPAEVGATLAHASVVPVAVPHSNGAGAPSAVTAAPARAAEGRAPAASQGSCTAPQLRRFIKSRTYVPMHELRRRFAINGAEDDMALIEVEGSTVFVGLPPREGALLGELLRGGEIGYELSLDPRTPVVVGLFPMRPIPLG